jgi:hypothetical protein
MDESTHLQFQKYINTIYLSSNQIFKNANRALD